MVELAFICADRGGRNEDPSSPDHPDKWKMISQNNEGIYKCMDNVRSMFYGRYSQSFTTFENAIGF